jgi:hypothetical protein
MRDHHQTQPLMLLTMKLKSRKENQLARGHTGVTGGMQSKLTTMPAIDNSTYDLKALSQLLSYIFFTVYCLLCVSGFSIQLFNQSGIQNIMKRKLCLY